MVRLDAIKLNARGQRRKDVILPPLFFCSLANLNTRSAADYAAALLETDRILIIFS